LPETGDIATIQEISYTLGALFERGFMSNIRICNSVYIRRFRWDGNPGIYMMTFVFHLSVGEQLQNRKLNYSVGIWLNTCSLDIDECDRFFLL
jgi:hypothetical protein